MWEFLNNLLEKAGVVAVIFAVTIFLGVSLGRVAWRVYDAERKERERLAREIKVLVEAHKVELANAIAAEVAKRSEMRIAFEKEKAQIAEVHSAALFAIEAERRAEALRYATRVDEIQERRLGDMSSLLERVISHVETMRHGFERLNAGLDVLADFVRR